MPEWIVVAVRTLIAIVILFVLTRLLGKRQVHQFSYFEYITGITIGGLAAFIPLQVDGKWHLGIVSLVVWIVVVILMGFFQLKSRKLRIWLDGKPTVLIKGGIVLEENLKKERITIDELLSQLRARNIFHISDVEFAVIEPNGIINAFVCKEKRPLTPEMIGLCVERDEAPHVVVADGVVLDEELTARGLDRSWLEEQLEQKGVTLEKVFIGQMDSDKNLYLDLYNDQEIDLPYPGRSHLLTILKKCEQDLMIHSLLARDEKTQKLYKQYSYHLRKLINEFQPHG